MKLRNILILIILLFSLRGISQPAETNYLGTVAKSGYGLNESYGPFNIGFNFTYFGNTYTQFYISSNGLVSFGAGSVDPLNVTIPTAATPNNYIAPFWDYLTIDPSGNILYTTIGAAPNRKLIVQFRNMGFYFGPVYMGTFSVILHETSGLIQVQYRLIVLKSATIPHGADATIGLENSTGLAGVLYSFNNPTAITSEQAIMFTPSGPTYTINPAAVYDGVYLTRNMTLPEPGITSLISPAENGTIGADHTFTWAASSEASSYALKISTNSSLSGATTYNALGNLSYDVTGLVLPATYYWGVFATNATGTTWSEVKKFTTSSNPPLAAVPQTIFVEQSSEKTITLNYTGGDSSAKISIITVLPLQGQLYQYNAGVKGALISAVPATVTDAGRNVIYLANGTSGNGVGNFSFKIHDTNGDSPDALTTVNVSPPGIPNLLYTAKSSTIELQFDRPMADPTGKQGEFTATVNGTPATISSLSLKAGDVNSIIVTLGTPLAGSETVLISYTAGTVASLEGGWLASFTNQSATLTAQTITFTQPLSKKFSDSPFTLTASVSSGLGMTYSSTDLAVVTAAGSILTFHSLGSADITARQAGNETYAPANYVRTLTVAKGDQTITFGVLAGKTYGDADYTPTVSASSALSVSLASDNPAVATIFGNQIHIIGAGTAVITASQAGNTLWNPAVSVPRTLTVSKADQTITFGVLAGKTYGDADYTPTASASSGLSVGFASDNPAVATIVSGNIHIVGAGTAVITASQLGNTNYNAAPDVPQTLTIGKAPLMATADNKTKTYGDVNPPLTITYTGFVGTDNQAVLDVPSVVSTTGLQFSDAGAYPIVASGGSDNNYSFSYTDGVLTINKADQTISFSVLTNKIYGDGDYAVSASASSALSISFSGNNTAVATVTGSQIYITGAGTAVITASQTGNVNYNAAPSVPQTLTVGKAVLTFTADNKSKEYLAQIPALTYTISGFVNGETQSILDVLPAIQTTAVQNSSKGTYPITITGGSDNNYTFIYIPGTLTITKLQQTITFTGFPSRLLVGDVYTLVATSTSGLPVLFESKDVSIATVSGDRLTGVSKGTVQIRAYHQGDLNYDAFEVFVTVEVYSTHKDIMHLFTPNNDGFNDQWELPDLSSWGKCDVKVYNRWGKLVFSDADYNNLWDGTSNGSPLPEGAYYFIIKTQNAGMVKGTVNIVR